MRRIVLQIFACLLVLLLLCACQKTDPNQHLDANGEPLEGFHIRSGRKHYYIDGYQQLGWVSLADGCYYLDAEGAATGWKDVETARYFFDADGRMQTGWLDQYGKQYFLAQDGKMHTGWLGTDQNRCYLGEDGALVTGWLTLDGEKYLLDENGIPVTGWQEDSGERYYFNDRGTMHTGWLEFEDEKYYFLDDGRMAKGRVETATDVWHFTSQGKYVQIVNFKNPIPEDFVPELVKWRNIRLEAETMEAVKAMILDGEAIGHVFYLNSAYRSWETQQQIWDNYYNKYIAQGLSHDEALKKVSMSVARPGTSEHHTGLAVDIDGTWASLGWMSENSWRYGLIVRYPEGKTEYTGVIYEPWHFRYVGEELAKELYELDLCVEEYMALLTQQQGR